MNESIIMKKGLPVKEEYGINNVLATNISFSTVKNYANIYSEKNGIRFILSNDPDFKKAVVAYPLRRGNEVVFPKAIKDNINPVEKTKIQKISMDEYFVACTQRRILKRLPGISEKDFKNTLIPDENSVKGTLSVDMGKIFFTKKICPENPEAKYAKVVFHLSDPQCIELSFSEKPEKRLISFEGVRSLYGPNLTTLTANTLVCYTEINKERNFLRLSGSFLKKHGFISEKKVTAVMCKEGILLLPVEKKSKISGKVLDGIENAADQLEVCAGCEEIIHDELTQKQITGEEGSIDKLMSIAQDLLSQQTEINKRLIFLMDVKKKAQKSPSEETARLIKEIDDLQKSIQETTDFLKVPIK